MHASQKTTLVAMILNNVITAVYAEPPLSSTIDVDSKKSLGTLAEREPRMKQNTSMLLTVDIAH